MERKDTGILLNDKNIKLHRQWFKQMTKLIGINVIYQAPIDDPNTMSDKPTKLSEYDPLRLSNMDEAMLERLVSKAMIKAYNLYGELDPEYDCGLVVGCIFDEHPTQKTMRKLGWNAEMADTSVVIHVPYDLPKVQAGARFIIPAGIDGAEPRVFRVLRMSNIAVYPASIACELGPVLFNTLEPEKITDFEESNFNLLDDESDEYGH